MKRTLLLFLSFIPFFLAAQTNDNFLENITIRFEKTNINTIASDFGPAFVEDELWFSAFKDDEINRLQGGDSKTFFITFFR